MNWNRLAQSRLLDLASQFPAVVVLEPRQVGKTTLARATFPDAADKDIESPMARLRFSLK
jgi:predicted AAA+ superfamily ATPase